MVYLHLKDGGEFATTESNVTGKGLELFFEADFNMAGLWTGSTFLWKMQSCGSEQGLQLRCKHHRQVKQLLQAVGRGIRRDMLLSSHPARVKLY